MKQRTWMVLGTVGALGCGSSPIIGNGGSSTGTHGGGGSTGTTSVTSGTSASTTTTGSGTGGSTGCTPGTKTCDSSDTVLTCNADGVTTTATTCPIGTTCGDGACTCSPGSPDFCLGDTITTCGADGQPHAFITCPVGTVCRKGLCDDIRCPDEISIIGDKGLPTQGWPRYRHDNRSSGWTTAVVPDNPTLKWKVHVGGTALLNSPYNGLAAGPVVNQNDVVFIGAGDGDGKGGHFYAFDGATGALIYDFAGPTGYGYTTPAVRGDGTAYYSTADGHAYAVRPDGAQLWAYAIGFQNDCSPIVTKDGYVIYGTDSDSLFALRPDGSLLWQSDAVNGPGEVDSALASSCDGTIYAGGAQGWTTLDATTGATLWRIPATGPVFALMSSPTVAADGTMAGIDSGGIASVIDKTGHVLWSRQVGPAGAATDFARVGPQLFAVLNDGSLHAFDQATGVEQWSRPVGNLPETYRHGGPVVDGHMHLFFASNDGYVYGFDTSGNQLFRIAASGVNTSGGNSFGSVAIGKDGTLYVPGNDGYLYAFH